MVKIVRTEFGRYATATESVDRLQRAMQKNAAEDAVDTFESTFAALAYTHLKNKAPRLLDYIVGFQLVDHNEDNTRAMGMFGFKVGPEWLMAPMFFIDGDMKGHELLYIKSKDVFVPLKENWVNYLISKKPRTLGSGTSDTISSLGIQMPRVHSDWMRKRSSDKIQPWVSQFATAIAKYKFDAFTKSAALLEDNLRLLASFDLHNVINTPELLKMAYLRLYRTVPTIKRGFDQFYGTDFFEKRCTALIAAPNPSLFDKAGASYVLAPKRSKAKIRRSLLDQVEEDRKAANQPYKEAALRIIVNDKTTVITGASGDELEDVVESVHERSSPGSLLDVFKTDEDVREEHATKEAVLRDGYCVIDRRTAMQKAAAYREISTMTISSPTSTGMYRLYEADNTSSDVLVFQKVVGNRDAVLVLRKDDYANYAMTPSRHLFVAEEKPKTPGDKQSSKFSSWVDSLPSVRTLKADGCYFIIDADYTISPPLHITEREGSKLCVNELSLHKIHRSDRSLDDDYPCSYFDPAISTLVISDTQSTRFHMVGSTLVVPKTAKICEIAKPRPALSTDERISYRYVSAPEPIVPATLDDVISYVRQKTAALSLRKTGPSEFAVTYNYDTRRLNKTAAAVYLIGAVGLDRADAEFLLKEATDLEHLRQNCNYRIVKAAAPVEQNVSYSPAFPEPDYGSEPVRNRDVLAQYGTTERVPIDGLESGNNDPAVYDPLYEPDETAVNVAQRAATTGQKEVFDSALFASMLKTVRHDSQLDKQVGDLFKALDSLGRILFMLYWHQDEYAERFGEADMPQIEESTQNAFDGVGDLVLYLKEKTIKGNAGIELAGVGGASAEPSLN